MFVDKTAMTKTYQFQDSNGRVYLCESVSECEYTVKPTITHLTIVKEF